MPRHASSLTVSRDHVLRLRTSRPKDDKKNGKKEQEQVSGCTDSIGREKHVNVI